MTDPPAAREPTMRRYTPLEDGILVIPEVQKCGFRRIAVVFLHGLGDVLMFRSAFDALRARLSTVDIIPYVLETQEVLISGARAWTGFDALIGFEAVFVIQFPMSEGTGVRKADFCARHELGLDDEFEIAPLKMHARSMVAVHFQGTSLPEFVNPTEDVCRQICEEISIRGYLPVETHFEHIFHNPVNSKYEWLHTTLRGNTPSISKLYSIIQTSVCFIGVASGPLVMALAIDAGKVIYLEKQFSITNYTNLSVTTVDVTQFDRRSFGELLDRKLAHPAQSPGGDLSLIKSQADGHDASNREVTPNIELSILRAKSRLSLQDKQIIEPIVQWEHEHFPEYFSGDEYYTWYYAIGQVVRPRRIAEIGVRYGYSLFSMARGSSSGATFSPRDLEIVGFDNESYNQGSCAIARANLQKFLGGIVDISICDTSQCAELGISNIDLFHVDGEHSCEGTLRDCNLAYRTIRPGGLLLLDDVDSRSDVRMGGDLFCDQIGQEAIYLPTSQGMYAILKRS